MPITSQGEWGEGCIKTGGNDELLIRNPEERAEKGRAPPLTSHNRPGKRFAAALDFAPADRGTQGAVIGYPGGGPESVQPAVVDGAVEAAGRDIYNQKPVTREIYVITAQVRPGNSGGPLVDLQGRVLGIVFATSASQPDQAYALTDNEVTTAVQKVHSPPSPIDTSHMQCAA